MKPANIYYTDCAEPASESIAKSIFSRKSTIVKPGMWQRKFKSNGCSGCDRNNEALKHTCDLKSSKSLKAMSSAVCGKLNNNDESSINEDVSETPTALSSNAGSNNQPFVLDSHASRQDILPISKLPSGGLSYFENLTHKENIYTGPPSEFLDKERLSKFASLLLLPHEMDRLIEVDLTTTTRLQKYSNFICPCGYISDAMGKDDHQKECYLSITTDAVCLSNYQSLMPKMCAKLQLEKLPKSENIEKNDHNSSNNIAIGRTIYFGIETGAKCGRVTKDFVDSNQKYQKFKQKVYKCPFCTFWCIDLLRFSSHISTHEPQKPFSCSACEYRSERNSGVSRHIQLRKWKDILHKDALVLTGNELWQNRFTQFKAYVVVTNRTQQQNDMEK